MWQPPSAQFCATKLQETLKLHDSTGEPAEANAEADTEVIYNTPAIPWCQKESAVQRRLTNDPHITAFQRKKK
jgi:hypothetical protein